MARFARHCHRSPAALGPDEIRTDQVHLTCERKLAPSAIEIAVCALRLLYKVTRTHPWSCHDVIPAPKQPRPLPVVLSPDEVAPCLTGVTRPAPRTILTTCDAAGWRISEAVHPLEAGTDIRTIQRLLGHRRLETTARSWRLSTIKVCATPSPLEWLPQPGPPPTTPPELV